MYLPRIFKTFMERHRELTEAQLKAGELASQAGPLDQKAQHLVQLGIAVGLGSQGGVRSHARRALGAGATREEIQQVVLLATTMVGFPLMIAAYGWIEEVLTTAK
ncbi:MAG: carboxymuconolactone decarboxylase family protein [Desulfomonile tiedjei]|nr:carboxymuconolactone decarboxylase family protein [Desulfomonile tiedjei]